MDQTKIIEQMEHCINQATIPGNDWRRELKNLQILISEMKTNLQESKQRLIVQFTTGCYDDVRDYTIPVVHESKEAFLKELKAHCENGGMYSDKYCKEKTAMRWKGTLSDIEIEKFLNKKYGNPWHPALDDGEFIYDELWYPPEVMTVGEFFEELEQQ